VSQRAPAARVPSTTYDRNLIDQERPLLSEARRHHCKVMFRVVLTAGAAATRARAATKQRGRCRDRWRHSSFIIRSCRCVARCSCIPHSDRITYMADDESSMMLDGDDSLLDQSSASAAADESLAAVDAGLLDDDAAAGAEASDEASGLQHFRVVLNKRVGMELLSIHWSPTMDVLAAVSSDTAHLVRAGGSKGWTKLRSFSLPSSSSAAGASSGAASATTVKRSVSAVSASSSRGSSNKDDEQVRAVSVAWRQPDGACLATPSISQPTNQPTNQSMHSAGRTHAGMQLLERRTRHLHGRGSTRVPLAGFDRARGRRFLVDHLAGVSRRGIARTQELAVMDATDAMLRYWRRRGVHRSSAAAAADGAARQTTVCRSCRDRSRSRSPMIVADDRRSYQVWRWRRRLHRWTRRSRPLE